MNQLDLIKELYDMYSEEKETLRIVESLNNGLGFNLDIKDRLADLYLEL